jgi:iron complex outermembrane recepter protein
MLIAGVENFTDDFYREHLDYRTGRGVNQPGVNFYFSTELTY